MTPDVDIMNNLTVMFFPVTSNEKGCDSEESFVTALDESSPLTKKNCLCDCAKCPERSDACCCQHSSEF